MAESKSRNLKLKGFSTKGLAGDLSAGLTKSIDSVTGRMANAVLAGVNPVYGLYTVIPIEQPAPAALPSNKVTLLHAYGSLFFAGARNLEEDLPQAAETHNAVVLLSLRGHADLGSTFIGVLERYAQALQAHGNTLMLVGVNPAVYDQLKATECLNVLGAENVFGADQLGASAMQAYQKAQQLIQAGSIRTQSVTEQNEDPN